MTNDLGNTGEKILFTERAISGSTFLGGPLAGIYLIAYNFRQIGKESAARHTWLIGIPTIIILIPLLMSIPEHIISESISKYFHLLWVIPVYIVVKIYQQKEIENHLASGGEKGSAWKATGIGFVSLVILLLYIFLLALIMTKNIEAIPEFEVSVVQMEKSGCIVYYDSTVISQTEARVAGAILEKVGYFEPHSIDVNALFYKMKDKYTVAVAVDESVFSDAHLERILKYALQELQTTYKDRRCQLRLLSTDPNGILDDKYLKTD